MQFTILQSVYKNDKSEFLDQCFESIKNNSLQPIKIVLVKDGQISTELDSIITKWCELLPIQVVGYEQNQGLAYALNYGLQFVETELVARMDSDDICYSDRFEKQINYFNLKLIAVKPTCTFLEFVVDTAKRTCEAPSAISAANLAGVVISELHLTQFVPL